MADYDLGPDEAFVHRQDTVGYGGRMAGYRSELILTSQNLVLVEKSALGKCKDLHVFPLNRIKIFQGHPQTAVSKDASIPVLDVYFENGSERFRFYTTKEATFWSQKINEVLIGTPAKMEAPGAVSAMDMFGEALSVFGTLGPKRKPEAAAAVDMTVVGDCVSCGAPISGIRGRSIVCPYCDSPNHL